MDEERRADVGETLERGTEPAERLDVRERTGGDRDADATAGEQPVDVAGTRLVERERAPDAEVRAELERSIEIGVNERLGFTAAERLDPQRAGDAHERPVNAVEAEQGTPTLRGFGDDVDDVWPLAGEVEDGELLLVADERDLVAFAEGAQERVSPDVLVYVDPRAGGRGVNDRCHRG
jgi:hypothetical protein